MTRQLGLFGDSDDAEPAPRIEPLVTAEDRELGEAVPDFVRFGTSSWSFPGWKGIVWKDATTEGALARGGLTAYAQHPLFRAVGLDRGYYAPVPTSDLTVYREQIAAAGRPGPPFRLVSKVWDEITTAVYPQHARYGARAGTPNPNFLSAAHFVADVLVPYRDADLPGNPFVFELTPMPKGALDERTLVGRVDDFLSRIPAGRYAFELRNAELFGARWVDMLRAHRAAHVFTYWTAMPSLRSQLAKQALTAPFTVVRLMLPPYTRYALRKAAFAPFDKLVEPQPEMRDDVIEILRAAADRGAKAAFVLVNNKAEGSAPLTVKELAKLAARAFHRKL